MPHDTNSDGYNPLWGKVIASAALFVAVIFAAAAIVLLGAAPWAQASPHFRPQKSDFIEGTFLCSGHVDPIIGKRVAEFSATYDGPWDMDVRLVEYIEGRAVNVTGDDIVSSVNGIPYGTGSVPLYGSLSDTDNAQRVLIRIEGIRPDQEFGVYAHWSPDGDDQPLERWFGYQKNKCGDPFALRKKPAGNR